MTILITESENYSKKAKDIYRSIGGVYCLEELKSKNLEKIKKDADILVVRLANNINKNWINKMPNLKIIATPTTGLNHINVDYAESQDIKVISLRGETDFLKNITSTAELSLALLLSLARNIPSAFDNVKSGKWDRMSFRGHQLFGKTLGIIGYGRLGKIMARYGKSLGMKVIACDPYIKTKEVHLVSLEELFKISDVISLHVLLTDSNKEFIKQKHFKMMKRSAYFINTSRAELIEKNSLHKALSCKWIVGAGIDVMDNEFSNGSHLKKDSLYKYAKTHNNLVIVPHIGGATFEAMHITEEFIAEEVSKYIKLKKLK